ncbi:ribosomal protein L5 domain-containing protein [Pisolithus orientalis]|uniref:ribosomal protein L5 domain-containing protein n=1 Tax=Pisolithus orientalis TaxID=936130 RepID=UPI0022250A07|nr:ribosomal protein L5 domain-containing protein [Pisolithus orientalis]KAI6030826.1 ribosomal protein L5 domain-containing protein [Pisolithus orientalis]
MSVAAAAAASVAPAVRAFRKPPRIRKSLKYDQHGLPIPHVDIAIRDIAPCRLREHYYTTLQDDLMYMTYVHESGHRPPPRQIRLRFDPNDPYSRNRRNSPTVVQLDSIVLHTMQKDAINNRSSLVGAIAAFRALSGETENGGGRSSRGGVEIVKGKKAVSGWVRPGLPLGCKVTLKGPKMYDFIATLTEFVFPRMREFNGIVLLPASSTMRTPSGVAGVVSFGLPPEAMGLFPQIEVNLDAYPKPIGFHVHFITNAEGAGAQNRARALLSGFQIPFARK